MGLNARLRTTEGCRDVDPVSYWLGTFTRMGRGNPENIFYAQVTGRVKRLQGAVRHADPQALDRSRDAAPEVWAAIDELLAIIDW